MRAFCCPLYAALLTSCNLQGERTLRDVEEKLYSSRQLLLSKEQELRELQSLLTGVCANNTASFPNA